MASQMFAPTAPYMDQDTTTLYDNDESIAYKSYRPNMHYYQQPQQQQQQHPQIVAPTTLSYGNDEKNTTSRPCRNILHVLFLVDSTTTTTTPIPQLYPLLGQQQQQQQQQRQPYNYQNFYENEMQQKLPPLSNTAIVVDEKRDYDSENVKKTFDCECVICRRPPEYFLTRKHKTFAKSHYGYTSTRLFILTLLLVNVVQTILAAYYYSEIHYIELRYKYVAKISASLIVTNMTITMLVSRKSFTNYILLHAISACVTMIVSATHTLAHILLYVMETRRERRQQQMNVDFSTSVNDDDDIMNNDDDTVDNMIKPQRVQLLQMYRVEYTTGVILVLWLFAVSVTSYRRRNNYRYFLLVHYVIYAISAVLLAHSPLHAVCYLPVLYDKIVNLIMYSLKPVSIRLIDVSKAVVRIRITYNASHFCGLADYVLPKTVDSHLYVVCSNISTWEKHPFTVIRYKNRKEERSYEIVVSSNGDWKRAFCKIANFNVDSMLHNDGYFLRVLDTSRGCMSRFLRCYDNLIFVLENVGISSFCSALNLLFDNNKRHHVKYYNIVLFYKIDMFAYYELLLEELVTVLALQFVDVTVYLYSNCKEFDHYETGASIDALSRNNVEIPIGSNTTNDDDNNSSDDDEQIVAPLSWSSSPNNITDKLRTERLAKKHTLMRKREILCFRILRIKPRQSRIAIDDILKVLRYCSLTLKDSSEFSTIIERKMHDKRRCSRTGILFNNTNSDAYRRLGSLFNQSLYQLHNVEIVTEHE
ncbi:dual oxidase 1 [Phenacoccus solenopsis nudivirus]|nr:dual oxidase 1 [Phenacoccus solenopsis nudivirus]